MNLQDTLLARCDSCGAINRIQKSKIHISPKCGQCHQLLHFPDKPIDISKELFEKEVLNWPGLVLVDFWAPWCGHCRNLNPVIEQIAKEHSGLVKIVKVNTQIETELALDFQVRGIPMLVLYQNGKKINQIAGGMSKTQLEDWIFASHQ